MLEIHRPRLIYHIVARRKTEDNIEISEQRQIDNSGDGFEDQGIDATTELISLPTLHHASP
ncbi:hypothetical protein EFD56_13590 [Rhizobium phaseoli]|nr:hypothetical protein EFD56_13590 [Rhizobium phaseoli]